MRSDIISINLFLFLLTFSLSASTWSDSCLNFTFPKQGAEISSQNCTLLVETECRNIRKIEFQARYFTAGSDTGTITSLGVVTRSPYKFVWDISKLPNQLLGGVAFLAEASLYNGQIHEIKREGVFFIHNTVERPTMVIPYEHSGIKVIKTGSITLDPPHLPMTIRASMYWNEKDITVMVEVKDPLFYATMSYESLAGMGLEVLIDPKMGRSLYPQKDVLIYNIPLYGKPYQILYKPEFYEDGSFKLNSSTKPCDFNYSVIKENFKGFKIFFPIPRKELSPVLPKGINLNLVVKTLEDGKIIRTPWIKGNQFETYSPYLWGDIQFQPKPVYKNRLLVWSVFFFVGLIITILFNIVLPSFKKSQNRGETHKSEAEQKIFNRVTEYIEQRITQKNTNIEIIAHELKISPKNLNIIIKKFTGMSFHDYLMYSRIEIAKERLRSSHCSETSIAEACGFHNANELEKFFVKFNHTTPYKFRVEQQVA